MGKLIIRVIRAVNLEDVDLFGKSDPYVIVDVEGESYKTRTIKNNLNPVCLCLCMPGRVERLSISYSHFLRAYSVHRRSTGGLIMFIPFIGSCIIQSHVLRCTY